MDKKLIALGDIHGRDFWKDTINHTDIPIVFIGDYLDPYEANEGITSSEAIDNFKEILDFARNNKNVILLYGNHDSYAFRNTTLCSCRHDWHRYDEICGIYEDNKDLFQFAYDYDIAGKHFLFTHAGIVPGWISLRGELAFGDDFYYTADKLNNPICDMRHYINILSDVSGYRGGIESVGSFLWADINEHFKTNVYKDGLPDNLVQVFGHSLLKEAIYSKRDYELYCIDCKKAVCLYDDGIIRYLADDSEIKEIKY